MNNDFQSRLLKEYRSDRSTEYFWAGLWVVAGAFVLWDTVGSAHGSRWTADEWAGYIVGVSLLILGTTGFIATTQRYALHRLKSSSSIASKKGHLKTIAKSPRLLDLHIGNDNAVVLLSGAWGRTYRIRIYFDKDGYHVHSTLTHSRFVSPVHLGFSSRQTDRIINALRTLDPGA